MERSATFIVAAIALVGLIVLAFNWAGRRDDGFAYSAERESQARFSRDRDTSYRNASPSTPDTPRVEALSPPDGPQLQATSSASRIERGQVVVTLAGRSDPALVDAGAVAEGDLVLVDEAGEYRHDSGDLRRGPVTLRFDNGATAGWLALRRDAITFEGSEVRAYFAPEQPHYERVVFEGRPGIRVRAGDVIELSLTPDGGLSGNVTRVQDGVTSEWTPVVTRLRVLPKGTANPLTPTGFSVPSFVRMGTVDRDGTFEVRGVEPGEHRVELMNDHVVLAVIDDVTVMPGASMQDPRLIDVDLLQHATKAQYTIVDDGGSSINGASITVYGPAGAAIYHNGTHRIDAWIPLAGSASDSILVIAEAPECAPTTCPKPYVDSTVTLGPRTRLELRAQAEFERQTNSHGFRMRLRLTGTSEAQSQNFAVEIPWDWQGAKAASLLLPGTGRYELEVMVLERMGSLLGQHEGDRFVPTGVFVDVHGTGDAVDIRVPSDLLQFASR